MTITQNNYLDLWNLYFNELMGDIWIGYFFGAIILNFLLIKASTPLKPTIMLNVLWVLIVFYGSNIVLMWVMTLLLIAGGFYYTLNKVIQR